MLFPTGIILVEILLISSTIEGFHHHGSRTKNDYFHVKRLYELLSRSDFDTDDELSLQTSKRVEASGDCIADVLVGYEWTGHTLFIEPTVPGAQNCMDICDVQIKCMAWSYDSSTGHCTGMAEVTGVRQVKDVQSGSCIGTPIKAECGETSGGESIGNKVQSLSNIPDYDVCISKCDQLNICYGWVYQTKSKQCHLLSQIDDYKYEPVNGYVDTTGTCFATQKRTIRNFSPRSFQQQSLDRHNLKRKKHCVPELKLDKQLNNAAQELANQFATADELPPNYDKSKMVTVFYSRGSNFLYGGDSVDFLYDEGLEYDYNKPDLTLTSHFPKIVWKSSKTMGFGRALTNDNGTIFIVTVYDWIGDMNKSCAENVLPPCA